MRNFWGDCMRILNEMLKAICVLLKLSFLLMKPTTFLINLYTYKRHSTSKPSTVCLFMLSPNKTIIKIIFSVEISFCSNLAQAVPDPDLLWNVTIASALPLYTSFRGGRRGKLGFYFDSFHASEMCFMFRSNVGEWKKVKYLQQKLVSFFSMNELHNCE